MFIVGSEVRLTNGLNTYKVLLNDSSLFCLECIEFVQVENLGDGIMASEVMSKTWVAGFFSYMFKQL